ncbi:MAG: T9SS type A sorting domain-containing protein, partial [Candidatus Marinimicrobia bacterium]|nr:T9SS type A sorting domain-containing protein [Candidatus Neomarinimicrobiota bacterium]
YMINNSSVEMNFVAITDDSARYGSAIRCLGSNLKISNSTIVNNGDYIGGIHLGSWTDINGNTFECEIFIVNSIFWRNGKYQIAAYPSEPIITIANSNIYEGIDKIRYGSGVLHWLDCNLDSDPLFIGGDPFDYHLTADSPCRETGTNLVVFEGDTLFYLPDSCYSGAAPNIGRWGVDPALGTESSEKIPERFTLYPNYPNPFNPSTTIRYEVPRHARVELIIFDITGRRIRQLIRSEQQPGYYQTIWNGKNDAEQEVPSGQYFLLMNADGFRSTQKMLLLK